MSLKNKGTANYIYELRRLIDLGFNVTELKTLCLDLGLDYDHLAGEQKQAKINELILYMGRRGLLATLRDVLVTERPNFDWPQVPNAEQQTQDITDFETGSTPTGRKLGCVTITFWISGMFTFLTGFAIFGYMVISFLGVLFMSFNDPQPPDLSSIPFHLLPVAVGLMFVGFVIFFIGVATGLIAGVRAPKITRALRRR